MTCTSTKTNVVSLSTPCTKSEGELHDKRATSLISERSTDTKYKLDWEAELNNHMITQYNKGISSYLAKS